MDHNTKLLANMLREKGIRYEEADSHKNQDTLIITFSGRNMDRIRCRCLLEYDGTIGGDVALSIMVDDIATVPSRNLSAMVVLLNCLNSAYPYAKFTLDAVDYSVQAACGTEVSTAYGQHCQVFFDTLMAMASVCDEAFPKITQTAQE